MTAIKDIENGLGSIGCRSIHCPITPSGGNNRVAAPCRCFDVSTDNGVMRVRLQTAFRAMQLKNDLIKATARDRWTEGYNDGCMEGKS